MKRLTIALAVAVAVAGGFGTAQADPDKDESGKGCWRYERPESFDRYRNDGERKEKFRTADGCEVEREWKRDEYEEKIKCNRSRD